MICRNQAVIFAKPISNLNNRQFNKNQILEQTSKTNSTRICGLEINNNNDVPGEVSLFITKNLNLWCTPYDLDFAFALNKGSKQGNKPTILVRFVSNIKKKSIMAAKKLLKNSGVTFFEDLTKNKNMGKTPDQWMEKYFIGIR